MSAAATNFIIQVGTSGGAVLTATISGVAAGTLGISGISATTRSAALSALSLVQNAVSNLTVRRENLGARIARLDQKLGALALDQQNTEASRSIIQDADLAYEEVQLAKFSILQQTALAMLGQANNAPAALLNLLPR